MALEIVILAAGLGTRMCSSRPKMLYPIGGKPLLAHVVDTAKQLNPEKIHIVVGENKQPIQSYFSRPEDSQLNWVLQPTPKGTADAVAVATAHFDPENEILILAGDVPLIEPETLRNFIAIAPLGNLKLLLAHVTCPHGLGRVIRDENGAIIAIREEKDATDLERAICEIYSGILALPASFLIHWLPKLNQNNAQGEFYLTDLVAMAKQASNPIASLAVEDPVEVQGINNPIQWMTLERAFQERQAKALLKEGVMIVDPARFDLRGTLKAGDNVFIDYNVLFQGEVRLGNNVVIEPNCVLKDVIVGDRVHIKSHCVIEAAHISAKCVVGPFARIRPGTQLGEGVKIGNFVEIKKSNIDEASKVNHLSYIGDATIGKRVNVGAGTITCNYDGDKKHATIIQDDAFIGSDTQLVAPVSVGENATIGAGTILRKDAPPHGLTVSGTPQRSILGWKRKRTTPKTKESGTPD